MLQVSTLIAFDWKQFSRSKVFWLLNLLLFFTGIYAAFYGKGEVKMQQQKIAFLQHDIDSSMQIIRQKLQNQDTIASWHYNDFLYALHANRPDGMAALAFGQRDLHKFAVSITIGTYFYNRYAGGYENKTLSGEIANPQKQFTGHLDISFVMVFLLPLFFILISYNLLSAEQENGTLALLTLQKISLRKLLLIKLSLRLSITIAAGWLLILLSAAITGALNDFRLFYFLLGSALYVFCWAGIVAMIIVLFKSSGSNALLLISIWLLFCIALPAAFTAFINTKYPQGTKADLVAAVQKANENVFNTSRRNLSIRFYKIYPQYNNISRDTFPGGWYNPRWMRALHLLLDHEVKPLEDSYRNQLRQRISTADQLDYYSPALLAQSIFNRAAASDQQQMFAYDGSIYGHFARWRDYIDERTYLHNDLLTKQEFNHLPVEGFVSKINYVQLNYRMAGMLFLSVVFWVLSYFLLAKNGRYIKS